MSFFNTTGGGVGGGGTGPKGDPGKSAYDYALGGGYTGSEADFYNDLAAIDGLADAILTETGNSGD